MWKYDKALERINEMEKAPLFICSKAQLCKGRGEKDCTELEPHKYDKVICKDPFCKGWDDAVCIPVVTISEKEENRPLSFEKAKALSVLKWSYLATHPDMGLGDVIGIFPILEGMDNGCAFCERYNEDGDGGCNRCELANGDDCIEGYTEYERTMYNGSSKEREKWANVVLTNIIGTEEDNTLDRG